MKPPSAVRPDAFSDCHPAVGLLWFVLTISFCMVFTHPLPLAVSLVTAAAYLCFLSGRRALRFLLAAALPVMLLSAVCNPLFSHEGVTILAYLPSGNPLTRESVLYGLAAAVMLAAALCRFACLSAVMTADKLVFLFGRLTPALSLTLAMALRSLPRFSAQLAAVRAARKGVGRDVTDGGFFRRVGNAAAILSALVTWALDNAAETAASMKGRGYGLGKRTAFSLYSIDRRDLALLLWLLLCGGFVLTGLLCGGFSWQWYPAVRHPAFTPLRGAFQLAHLLLCLTPLISDGWEAWKWKRLRSAI